MGKSAKGKAKKDVGHGGLDEWFSGHGSGKSKDKGKATWGDWVSISPVDKTIEKEDGTKKKIEKGDIVGECGISKDPDWKDITDNGKSPLKCMPRQKAYKMDKKERAELAKNKQKAEKGNNTQKPTMTPTFKKENKKAMSSSIQRVAYRFLIAKSKKNVPTKPELWDKVIEMAKGDRKSVSEGEVTINAPNDGDGFEKYPTAYANGWASKVYGDLGGGWKVED